MRKFYAMFFVMVFAVPLFLGVDVWQSNICGALRADIRRIEREQENLVDENRSIAAEIAKILAVGRIETDAKDRLGMSRVSPENVMMIILGGDANGR
jgi:cell division protein FtsB